MSKKNKLLKLDLGCGTGKKPGFFGVDVVAKFKPDLVLDLRRPWPWGKATVGEVNCSIMLQYFTGPERMEFFNKLHEIMVKGAQATILIPHGQSTHAWMDPYVQWPPMNEGSFLFLNKEWRENNSIPHEDIKCDFDFGYGFGFQNGWNQKSEEARNFALVNYMNVVNVMQVTLTRR